MKSKILIIGLIAIIAIVAVFLVLQKEEVKVHDVDEAFSLLKENYSISNDYSVVNITNISNANGWRFEFLKVEGNCSLECIERHIYFEVYKNGSVIKSENSTNVTKLENENDALNYILYKFPEFKNISKCEFEEKLMCHQDIIVEGIDNGWNIIFMNESKGCNNECVIEHHYSFLVEKDGKIARSPEMEKIITLEDIIGNGEEYPDNIDVFDAGRWYMENEKIISYAPWNYVYSDAWLPWKGILWNEIAKIHNTVYVNTNKKKIYLITESTYNLLLEKFSTKTINNESDVLKAFERYLKLFQLECYRIEYSKDGKREKGEYIMCKFSNSEFLKEFTDKMKCKTYKENNSWMLECEINSCVGTGWIKGKWKARISENGGVYIVEKDIGVVLGECLIL